MGKIAEDFYNLWQFPNCLGALNGQHISFRAPVSDRSYYYNYKGFHSIVLLAMCDARYKFTYVNVGTNGRINDGGVFQQSLLQKALNNPHNSLNFPQDKELPGQKCKVPFVIIADDAFPLSKRLIKPYSSRGLTEDCKIFYYYRLSRARRMIESSFGLLVNRFRVLLNPINLSAEKVEIITLACVVLHNYLICNNNEKYAESILEESHVNDSLMPLGQQGSNNSSLETRLIRDEFKNFFNTSGAVPWQQQAIRNNNL
ncbi:hypothetical protein ILUMI_05673 [Ignelater luminosus]|uniref:DDE Tnp4 domain-containing protein n=1 Tax=Ignelater luminosus TaxID=2038154 RepID=A0A8K0DBH6_IGNLU|nr:hypothetical protein ILUMI_05673 [Ignelater luminosus]